MTDSYTGLLLILYRFRFGYGRYGQAQSQMTQSVFKADVADEPLATRHGNAG